MRIWISTLGEEAVYEADLPSCCRKEARGAGDSFECISCGAAWQKPLPTEPEECAFTESREQKGAA